MHSERLMVLVLAAGFGAPLACAQDYGDRDIGADRTIRDNSVVSASVVAFAGNQWNVINADGHAEVQISEYDNPMFVDIGRVRTDSGEHENVQVSWSEVRLPSGRYVEFTFRTEGGGQFVPFNSNINGNRIQAYSYEIGGDGNGIDFRAFVTEVFWEELTISYSPDGGQTVFSDPTIFDPLNGAPWDGTDDNHFGLAFPGDGVNWIRASYKIDVVPAPGTAALLAAGGLLGLRRRRG
jgi:hypothetical protein